jgi:hypothetical protein
MVLCGFAACGPSPIKRSLEVTALRYDTTNLTDCGGDVRNISPHTISDLQVQVEFQNADRNRVRIATGSVSPTSLGPNAVGSFSVSYVKGSNDPPVVRCRAIEFRSAGVQLLYEDDATPMG